MSEPSPDQSFFSIHLKSLTDFADEFTTQIQSLQAPMEHLATMSGTPPQYGAFHEAWTLGAGEQAAIEEMHILLDRVKGAIGFAGDVTRTVAEGYRKTDEDIAYGMGGAPTTGNGGYNGSNAWANNQYGGQDQNRRHGDPNQNNQNNQNNGDQNNQVYATPVSNTTDPGPWVPNQNTSGPFPGTPFTAVPVAGALLGGALLGGAAKSKSHQPPANTSVSLGLDAEGGSAAPGGALPLWTPPPDPGPGAMPAPPAPAPVFPGQDASWTATFPDSPQGGS